MGDTQQLQSAGTAMGLPAVARAEEHLGALLAEYSGGQARVEPRTFTRISVLMPLYNERWTLRAIVAQVLAVPLELDLELVVVDDGSTDGSWELLQRLAEQDDRIRPIRHERNRGKGAAVRTAISHMTGDVAVVQDADLEYDPNDYPRLLQPILDGKADAVFGSRFSGHSRRASRFWHSLVNRGLTLVSNALNDVRLTDMETCYKMVRADALTQLRLTSNTFTLEPELACRLAQWGARIYEVPVSYNGRTFDEGKKIGARDGLKALGQMVRCRLLDKRFTSNDRFYTLKSTQRARQRHRLVLRQCRHYIGSRVLEVGAGIGSLSRLLLDRDRLVLVEEDPTCAAQLARRFGFRENVRVEQADPQAVEDHHRWQDERLDTVLCCGVLERLETDEPVLRSFYETLTPGGHLIVVAPAGPQLYCELDRALGRKRRYDPGELRDKIERAGFEAVYTNESCRLGSAAWWALAKLLRRRRLRPWQLRWSDRLFRLAGVFDRLLSLPPMSITIVGRRPLE